MLADHFDVLIVGRCVGTASCCDSVDQSMYLSLRSHSDCQCQHLAGDVLAEDMHTIASIRFGVARTMSHAWNVAYGVLTEQRHGCMLYNLLTKMHHVPDVAQA